MRGNYGKRDPGLGTRLQVKSIRADVSGNHVCGFLTPGGISGVTVGLKSGPTGIKRGCLDST